MMHRWLLALVMLLGSGLAHANDFYNHGSYPTPGSPATSAGLRAELDLIATGFDKLPALGSPNANKLVMVNPTGTALTASQYSVVLGGNFQTSGAYDLQLNLTGFTSITLPTTGTVATLAGAETLSSKTLPSPAISSPTLTGTITGDVAATGNLEMQGTGSNAIGAARNTNNQLLISGTYTPAAGTWGSAMALRTTVNAQTDQEADGFYIGPTIVRAIGGTHPLMSSLQISAPVIAPGSSTITNAASVYITDAPTAGTNNYALWVAGGLSRFQGTSQFDSTMTASDINSSGTVAANNLSATTNIANSGTWIGNASGAGSNSTQFYLTGTWNPIYTNVNRIETGGTMNVPANSRAAQVWIGGAIAEAGSGTHPMLAGLYVQPSFTNGSANATEVNGVRIDGVSAPPGTTTAATLYLQNSGGASNNYPLYVTSGQPRFSGGSILIDGSANPYVGLNDGSDTSYLQVASGNLDLYSPGSITISPVSATRATFDNSGLSLTGDIYVGGSATLGSPLGASYGGLGTSATPSNGQIPIGNGSGYSIANLWAGSGISISDGPGSITISNTQDTVPAGTIAMYGGGSAPSGWLLCDGSGYSTGSYGNLFSAIGYNYGGGGGTFYVPDFQNRQPYGPGSRWLGDTGGEESHTLSTGEMPSHAHSLTTTGDGAGAGGSVPSFYDSTPSSSVSTNSAGGGGSHNVLDPYLVVQFIIKTKAKPTRPWRPVFNTDLARAA